MNRKILAVCLSLVLCLSLAPAALADGTAFEDVPAGSWFENGVKLCEERGIMVGMGDGTFGPDAELTAAQCLTLALRLYDLQRGGDGTLETAPEDWGKLELTLSDGTTFTRYGELPDDPYSSFHYDSFDSIQAVNQSRVYVTAPGGTAEEQSAWAKAHEGKATLRVDGVDYPGTVAADVVYHRQPTACLRFTADGDYPSVGVNGCMATKPGPDKWFRNSVYTAKVWGLSEKPGFDSLVALCYGSAGREGWCHRENFALALSVAAGELEKKFTVGSIPDLKPNEYNDTYEHVHSLYEAGILNGLDHIGTFYADKQLTRAEAATMAARVLDPNLRLTEAPEAGSSYDLKVSELRTQFGYYNERTFESEECTVFLYDTGGAMRRPKGIINIIYKPGSALGDGTVVSPPLKSNTSIYTSTNPDEACLSEDGTQFIYSYRFFDEMNYPGEDTEDFSYDFWRHKCGVYTYTVDLATGETTEAYTPEILITPEELEEADAFNFTIENTWDTPFGKVVLYRAGRDFPSDHGSTIVYTDYKLKLIYGGNSGLPAGTVKSFILPSTERGQDGFNPTNRAPDSVELSADGATLVYRYTFEKPLSDETGVLLHDAGTYTYTVDLATGELSVTHTER